MANNLKPPHLEVDTAATVYTGAGFLNSVKVTGGTAKDKVTIYDNTAASGSIMWTTEVGSEEDISDGFGGYRWGKAFDTGLYVDFETGSTGALVIITLG